VIRNSKTARGPRLETERIWTGLSSAEATRRLRDLLTQEPSSSHRFETVERWVGHLDDSAIGELIEELGMEEYAGLTGWVRCALYAEWARRDPRGALARAEALPDSGDHRNYAVQQVLFSVLRGWAESDPEAALAENQRLGRRINAPGSVIVDLVYPTACPISGNATRVCLRRWKRGTSGTAGSGPGSGPSTRTFGPRCPRPGKLTMR